MSHPVLPSLLYQSCDSALQSAVDLPNKDELSELRAEAEAAILASEKRANWDIATEGCDVILCCDGQVASQAQMHAAIQSVLGQLDVTPILHLGYTVESASVADKYAGHWNVRLYPLDNACSPLALLHEIAGELQSCYIAVQTPESTSHARRLQSSIRALKEQGAELFLSDVTTSPCDSPATRQRSSDALACSNAIDTLVMRRGTFIDMGGAAERHHVEREFLVRASCENRAIATVRDSLVESKPESESARVVEESVLPKYADLKVGRHRQAGRGFEMQPVRCDVVLPFFGHVDFAEEALRSLLAQEQAQVVVHLIDDASPEDTTAFLNRYSSHPNVRVYRNSENIGQFASFNNVSRFFETDLVAVQDADDLSLPHRMFTTGNLLRLADADYVGAAVELFGAVGETSNHHEVEQDRAFRVSTYLRTSSVGYFVENPTAMFRVSMFRNMGGYANFGNRLANRASLDTEFLIRCAFQHVRFAVSREVVTMYRVHDDSATRNDETGWGTPAREDASRQLYERRAIYRRGPFDPRVFGAIGYRNEITQRFS